MSNDTQKEVRDEFGLYSQDYLQEDEEICDGCKKVKKLDELTSCEEAIVCKECEQTGWPEVEEKDR